MERNFNFVHFIGENTFENSICQPQLECVFNDNIIFIIDTQGVLYNDCEIKYESLNGSMELPYDVIRFFEAFVRSKLRQKN